MSSANRGAPAQAQDATPTPSESLEKLKRGELSLGEYLDEAVENALAHVKGRVTADMLDNFRVTLRESLRTDPTLIEIVQRLTSQTPQPETPTN